MLATLDQSSAELACASFRHLAGNSPKPLIAERRTSTSRHVKGGCASGSSSAYTVDEETCAGDKTR